MKPRHLGLWVLALLVTLTSSTSAARDEADRDRRLQPERVMDAAGVRPGMVVGEVGAGRGYFTVKLAHRVGPEGRVFANDIDEHALAALERRCSDEGLENVVTVLGEATNPLLPGQSLDVVFIVYTIHHIEEPVVLLKNLESSLAQGAVVVVLDEDPEATGNHHFLSRQQVRDVFAQAGYRRVPLDEFLDRDLLLAFRPTSR